MLQVKPAAEMLEYKGFYSCINPDMAWISTAGCVGRMVVTSRRRGRRVERRTVKHVAQIKDSDFSNIWIQAGLFVLFSLSFFLNW